MDPVCATIVLFVCNSLPWTLVTQAREDFSRTSATSIELRPFPDKIVQRSYSRPRQSERCHSGSWTLQMFVFNSRNNILEKLGAREDLPFAKFLQPLSNSGRLFGDFPVDLIFFLRRCLCGLSKAALIRWGSTDSANQRAVQKTRDLPGVVRTTEQQTNWGFSKIRPFFGAVCAGFSEKSAESGNHRNIAKTKVI